MKEIHVIDKKCPKEGQGTGPTQAQNGAKNNFCASHPIEVDIDTLRRLEAKTQAALIQAGIPFGSPTQIPPDRERLEQGFTVNGMTLREGRAVFIRAFVLEAHYSNLGNGERVNCNIPKKQNNDIHIALGKRPGADHCSSITAEISPHFRPSAWSDFDDYLFTHPVMIMGQLFYDASHRPCTPEHRVNPARSSSWEIHPVYSIFICRKRTLKHKDCPPNPTDPAWVAFDEWIELPDDEVPGHHAKKKERLSFP